MQIAYGSAYFSRQGIIPIMPTGLHTFETFDGISLCYESSGHGTAIIFLHGFIVDSRINWIDAGLMQLFVSEGFRAIALDARGHGRSDKPHDPKSYAARAMAKDVIALCDELGPTDVVLVGYSMGGYTALEVALLDDRIAAVVACGVGVETDEDHATNPTIVDELLAETAPPDAFYRSLVDQFAADRFALAARLQGAILPQLTPGELSNIQCKVHIINGADDVHDAGRLAALIPNATAISVQGDHISTVTDPTFGDALIAFVQSYRGK